MLSCYFIFFVGGLACKKYYVTKRGVSNQALQVGGGGLGRKVKMLNFSVTYLLNNP